MRNSRENLSGRFTVRLHPGNIQHSKGMSEMRQVRTATVKSIYSKALSWFRTGVNLAELNALDSRTLLDIGLNRNEFHAAADPITLFERGAALHEAPTQCVSLPKSTCLAAAPDWLNQLARDASKKNPNTRSVTNRPLSFRRHRSAQIVPKRRCMTNLIE
jgi:uncharacterized protein YjiS (DUF1127 family)